MNETEKNVTYSYTALKLEKIVENIEANRYNIDELSEKVKESVELIAFLKQKLKETDAEIEKLISEIE
ncbi:MAG: exodeoxyribonuclease VII small subunit [Prevotellaceae bacterium]|jgi:exodeoxyribonuclease VII small subunit|nr:exodeoxyribonuclease VII small subunit [Prevotellaceae bacterium]